MISFIVIGRNEGKKLITCLNSIHKMIDTNDLIDYEIIYIDSKSTDQSIEIVKEFKNVKIAKLTGTYNAAIARNLGAKLAKGAIYFFIDGDMEIIPEFLPLVYAENKGLKYDYVSGQLEEHFYDINKNFLKKKKRFVIKKNYDYCTTTGGIFLIKKDVWNSVNGMKNKYKRSQDIDLGLRLALKGIRLLRMNKLIAIHHTINYLDKNRALKDLLQKNYLYSKSLLYRDHVFNKFIYRHILTNDYSLILFVITGVFSIFMNTFIPVLFYLFVVLIRAVRNQSNYNILNLFLFYALRDISVFLGFFLFFPKKISNSKIKYELA